MDANIGRFISKKINTSKQPKRVTNYVPNCSRFDFSRCIVFILHLDIYFISSV